MEAPKTEYEAGGEDSDKIAGAKAAGEIAVASELEGLPPKHIKHVIPHLVEFALGLRGNSQPPTATAE